MKRKMNSAVQVATFTVIVIAYIPWNFLKI